MYGKETTFLASTFTIMSNARATNFPKPRSYHKSPGNRMVKRSMFHTEDTQILTTTTHNSDTWANWCPGFVHPLSKACGIQ